MDRALLLEVLQSAFQVPVLHNCQPYSGESERSGLTRNCFASSMMNGTMTTPTNSAARETRASMARYDPSGRVA